MIDREPIDIWLEAYRHAWTTDDRDEVAALFTPDSLLHGALPRAHDGHRPGFGLVLGMKEGTLPWTFEPEVLAQEGHLYVVRALVHYPAGEAGSDAGTAQTYYDLWLVTLTAEGRAREFVEYFMAPE